MTRMEFDAFIFDLDGTLLDTLPDLTNLTNVVLEERGMPTHTADEVNSYVGSGARMLIKRAVPEGTSEEDIDAIMARWKELYPTHGHAYTRPYDGMTETLDLLKEQGIKLGVLSNKFDAATRSVIEEHFPGMFDLVWGESPSTPRKPDPTGLLNMMAELGIDAQRCAYVGDSGSDMTVALNAGAVPIGVTWGYRSAEVLLEHGARALVSESYDLLHVCVQSD